MNRLQNIMPFLIGRMNKQKMKRLMQPLRGKRNNRGGMWLSMAALAATGAAYGMQRKQINRGLMRLGQSLRQRLKTSHPS